MQGKRTTHVFQISINAAGLTDGCAPLSDPRAAYHLLGLRVSHDQTHEIPGAPPIVAASEAPLPEAMGQPPPHPLAAVEGDGVVMMCATSAVAAAAAPVAALGAVRAAGQIAAAALIGAAQAPGEASAAASVAESV